MQRGFGDCTVAWIEEWQIVTFVGIRESKVLSHVARAVVSEEAPSPIEYPVLREH